MYNIRGTKNKEEKMKRILRLLGTAISMFLFYHVDPKQNAATTESKQAGKVAIVFSTGGLMINHLMILQMLD